MKNSLVILLLCLSFKGIFAQSVVAYSNKIDSLELIIHKYKEKQANQNLEEIFNGYSSVDLIEIANKHLGIRYEGRFGLFCDTLISYLPIGFPLKLSRPNSMFGYRMHPTKHKVVFHKGLDLAGRYGDRVYACGSGLILEARYGNNNGLGNYVKIQHRLGFVSIYGHLSSILKKEGDWIYQYEALGEVGSTGDSTGEHLHLSILRFNIHINPLPFFSYSKQKPQQFK